MCFNRYLVIPNVLSAAISRGCTMLHPGYGFLAENAVFVEMCREHGINFIGPNVSTLKFSSYCNSCGSSIWSYHYLLYVLWGKLWNSWWLVQPDSIRVMGDKSTARDTMKKAGVPTVPGSDGLLQVYRQSVGIMLCARFTTTQ